MPSEHDQPRPASPAPRGCVVTYLVVVLLAVVLIVLVVVGTQPRFLDADPF